jgi:hypothetical protein
MQPHYLTPDLDDDKEGVGYALIGYQLRNHKYVAVHVKAFVTVPTHPKIRVRVLH